MRIEKLQISKYGKLNNFKEIKFEPNLNVVFGKNGVGKTSLAHAIFHTLFGVGLKFFKYPYSEDGKITGQTTDVQLIVNKNGEGVDHIVKYINCALNDDWEGIRGARDELLDNLAETVIK